MIFLDSVILNEGKVGDSIWKFHKFFTICLVLSQLVDVEHRRILQMEIVFILVSSDSFLYFVNLHHFYYNFYHNLIPHESHNSKAINTWATLRKGNWANKINRIIDCSHFISKIFSAEITCEIILMVGI